MNVIIQRTRKTDDGIFGKLSLDFNLFTCFTVENKAMAIAPGIYPVVQQYSPHFNRAMPHIIVPGRTVLMFHWANYAKQLEGCIALGDKQEADAVDNSIATFNRFDALTKNLNGLMVDIRDEVVPDLL